MILRENLSRKNRTCAKCMPTKCQIFHNLRIFFIIFLYLGSVSIKLESESESPSEVSLLNPIIFISIPCDSTILLANSSFFIGCLTLLFLNTVFFVLVLNSVVWWLHIRNGSGTSSGLKSSSRKCMFQDWLR